LRLTPPGEATAPDRGDGQGADAPAASSAADPSQAQPVPADDRPADSGREGVEVDRLDEMTLETIGVLDGASGALGADMWAGTPRHRVEALLPRLPAGLQAPVLRDLARRLLLSPAAAPERRQAQGGGDDLLALRIDRLAALGLTAGLRELIAALPRDTQRSTIVRRRVEALLLAGERAKACQRVRQAVRGGADAFWQRALAVCQLADGETAQALLTTRLLREGGGHGRFLALFDAAEAGAADLPEPLPKTLGPLHLALIEVGGLPLPVQRLETLSPALLAAIATGGHGDLELRAAAAERAAAFDVLPLARLAELYRAFSFPQDRLAEAASLESERAHAHAPPVRQRALLYQALEGERAPAVRAELLHRLLTDRGPGDFLAAARLLAEPLAQLDVRPDLAWFAPTAGRALFAAGRAEAAGRWLRMAQQEAIINPKAAAAVTALWPHAVLSGAGEVPANGGLGAWRQAQDGTSGEAIGARESLLRALLAALGRAPERSWVEIAMTAPVDPRPAPPAALIYALQEAGDGGRRGEAVLLTLLALGPQGLAGCHPAAVGTAVHALKQVGLADAAHRLALEAAVFNGI
jgi:hypothetical protein